MSATPSGCLDRWRLAAWNGRVAAGPLPYGVSDRCPRELRSPESRQDRTGQNQPFRLPASELDDVIAAKVEVGLSARRNVRPIQRGGNSFHGTVSCTRSLFCLAQANPSTAPQPSSTSTTLSPRSSASQTRAQTNSLGVRHNDSGPDPMGFSDPPIPTRSQAMSRPIASSRGRQRESTTRTRFAS